LDAVLRGCADWQKRTVLEKSVVHCCHCGIRFFTHPRNAGRRDLRCPFGCREHHRRQRANERSKKHYRTDEGRKNKKSLNGKRSLVGRDIRNTPPVDAVPTGVSTKDAGVPDSGADATPTDEDATASDTSSWDACPSVALSLGQPIHQRVLTRQALPRPAHEEAPRQDVKLMLDGFALGEADLVNSSVLSYLAMVATVLEGRAIGREELLHVLRRSMRQRSFDRLPRREYALRFLNKHPP
jgi:hypothetical protein